MPVWRKPMSGVARVMFSPSSSIITRSTPCVDGCCGPILRVIRLRRSSSSVGFASSTPTCASSSCMVPLFVLVTVLVAVHRIIFAKRVAGPVGRHHDPAKVGMIGEADSKQIERLAFVPVRAAPDAGHGFDLGVLADAALQPQPLVTRNGMKQVDHFEARIGWIPVDRGDSTDAVELVSVSQKTANVQDGCRSDEQRQFAVIVVTLYHGVTELRGERRSGRVLGTQAVWNHSGCPPPGVDRSGSSLLQSSAPFFQM